jgi:hypothetical protein
MVALLCFFLTLFASPFKSKSRLEAENAALRHKLAVLRRKVRGRVQLTNGDRLFLIQLYRRFPSILKLITIIRPSASPSSCPGIGGGKTSLPNRLEQAPAARQKPAYHVVLTGCVFFCIA